MTCTCGHPDFKHATLGGCYGPPTTFRPDRGLCSCPKLTPPCGCGRCTNPHERKP